MSNPIFDAVTEILRETGMARPSGNSTHLAALQRIAGRGCMHSPHYCTPRDAYDACSPCIAAEALGLERRKV